MRGPWQDFCPFHPFQIRYLLFREGEHPSPASLVRLLRTTARQSPSDPWKSSSLLISAETWEERSSENVMPDDCWKASSEEKCENVKRIIFLVKSFVSGTLYYYILNQWYLIWNDGSLKIGFSFFPWKFKKDINNLKIICCQLQETFWLESNWMQQISFGKNSPIKIFLIWLGLNWFSPFFFPSPWFSCSPSSSRTHKLQE